MSPQRTGPRAVHRLTESLSERDLAIIARVADHRLMSGFQLHSLFFAGNHESAASAARSCRRVLAALTADRLLLRIERRVGGLRAGSGSWVYAIGPVGQRALSLEGPRSRFREPSPTFLAHTLAVSQLAVDVAVAARSGVFEILACQPEPRCWRLFSGASGTVHLRPDLFLAVGIGDYEQRWFIELDRGNEHLPALLRKCRIHEDYYRSGKEQAVHRIHPQVCWVMPHERLAQRLRAAIDADDRFTAALFIVTTNEMALPVLTEGAS